MDRSNTLPPLRSFSLPRGNVPLPPIHEILYDRRPTIPSSCLRLRLNVPTSAPTSTMRKIRLVHTSLENADAVLLIEPPSSPDTPPPPPLFLFGRALQQLRRNQRPLAKDARVYPYRVVDRRPPTESPDTKP